MSEIICQTVNLSKKYKGNVALENVNINIKKGEIYGLIGENGAGKTTLIKIIAQLIKPTEGDVKLFGKTMENELCTLQRKIGYTIENPALYMDMTARQNLEIIRIQKGIPGTNDIDRVLSVVNLSNTGKKKVKNFSLGMKQRLGIAIALANNPDFLILDEPINGLDPQGIIEIRELILKLNREKSITILISSHYLDELSKIATNYGFLDNGSIIKEISSEELMKKMEHKIEFKVSNQKDFVKYFERNKISYEVIDNETINVYGKYNLSKLITELSKKNLIADEVHEQEESLENYYMNLIGGANND